jgi:hypothetical protein
MFSLHETTQRRVCRMAFVVGALVPTLLTLVWAAHSLRPWREADWQRTLSQQLHVHSSVDHITSPRPGIDQLTNVRLADLRSELPLAALDEVRAQWLDSRLVLVAGELQVEVNSFPALGSTLAASMSAGNLPEVELQADRLIIVGRLQQTFSLHSLRMVSQLQEGRSRHLILQAMLPPTEQGGAGQPLRLVVEQHGKLIKTTLHTGAAQLPSWLLPELLPSVAHCEGTTFSGSMQLEADQGKTSGSLRGRLAGLKLSEWLGVDSPHALHGTAHVGIDQLVWRDGRIVSARGTLKASRGAVGRSLLVDAVKRFYCLPGASAALEGSPVESLQPFDELACEFHLGSEGISLTGKCVSTSDAEQGCLLAVDGRSLLLEPPYANLPVALVVQVFSQPASSWLPASREAHDMAGTLPLPNTATHSSKEKEVAVQSKDSSSR